MPTHGQVMMNLGAAMTHRLAPTTAATGRPLPRPVVWQRPLQALYYKSSFRIHRCERSAEPYGGTIVEIEIFWKHTAVHTPHNGHRTTDTALWGRHSPSPSEVEESEEQVDGTR